MKDRHTVAYVLSHVTIAAMAATWIWNRSGKTAGDVSNDGAVLNTSEASCVPVEEMALQMCMRKTVM